MVSRRKSADVGLYRGDFLSNQGDYLVRDGGRNYPQIQRDAQKDPKSPTFIANTRRGHARNHPGKRDNLLRLRLLGRRHIHYELVYQPDNG